MEPSSGSWSSRRGWGSRGPWLTVPTSRSSSTIYFCAREALQNTTKHAGPAAEATVALRRRRGTIDLTITDNGVGMSPETASNGIGIVGMRDRIEAVNGQFKLVSHPGQGTRIHATIPNEPAAESDAGTGRSTQKLLATGPRIDETRF